MYSRYQGIGFVYQKNYALKVSDQNAAQAQNPGK